MMEALDIFRLYVSPLGKLNGRPHATTGGGEYHGPCPFCGGVDRFVCHPHQTPPKWWCRKCNRGGTLTGLIAQKEGLSFGEALGKLKELGLQDAPAHSYRVTPVLSPPSNLLWQRELKAFFREARAKWSLAAAAPYKAYLEQRGFKPDWYLHIPSLGLNLTEYSAQWHEMKVWLPAGLVFLWQTGQQAWAIRVRRLDADKGLRYLSARGSSTGKGLFSPRLLSYLNLAGRTVVLTEGEIDALSVAQALDGQPVSIYATGGVTGGRSPSFLSALQTAKRVIIAFDNDEAGDKGATWWLGQLKNAVRYTPPVHDLNEMLQKGLNFQEMIA